MIKESENMFKVIKAFAITCMFEGVLFGILFHELFTYTCSCEIPAIIILLWFIVLYTLLVVKLYQRIANYFKYEKIAKNIIRNDKKE